MAVGDGDCAVTDDRTDPGSLAIAALTTYALRDRYISEQQELQPDLGDALRQALGSGFDVQISVGAGSPKPRVALYGTTFWPDISVLRDGAPLLGVEVKHIREGQSPSKAFAETIGQCLIYRLLYPQVIGFVLRDGATEPEPLEDEARLREMLAKCGIDLVIRYRDESQ